MYLILYVIWRYFLQLCCGEQQSSLVAPDFTDTIFSWPFVFGISKQMLNGARCSLRELMTTGGRAWEKSFGAFVKKCCVKTNLIHQQKIIFWSGFQNVFSISTRPIRAMWSPFLLTRLVLQTRGSNNRGPLQNRQLFIFAIFWSRAYTFSSILWLSCRTTKLSPV